MPSTSGTVQTEHASKYLQQLCKHWSHKANSVFDTAKGTVKFDSGEEADLEASDGILSITARVSGDDAAQQSCAAMVLVWKTCIA